MHCLNKYFTPFLLNVKNHLRWLHAQFIKISKEQTATVSVGSPCILLSAHVSCPSVFLSARVSAATGLLLDFSEFCMSVQRHGGNFWLHLHVKWSTLLCGRAAPPDSPSPVACQSEPASSPRSSLPAGVGHGCSVRNVLRSCQSLRCRTRVNLLKSSRLARTNATRSLPHPARQTKARARY